jgi:hypothetical protein
MHDSLIRGLASNGKAKIAATRGPGTPWLGFAPRAGVFSGFQYPTPPLLKLTICEPALGSGAFLNEAVNQLARAYLDRIQEETGQLIPPERMQEEERKVRAHLALHQCYGVDLNQTAVELAEVSLWLNVMHPGLQGPWFGLHLRRGNSLIGARRAVYKGVPDKWHGLVPEDRPLSAGPIGDGEVHHFLLPAHGWGAVGSDKRAKELAEFEADRLKKWAASIKKKPSTTQVKRLQALARRVERVWELALRRLEIAESEVARHINVWGADPSWLREPKGDGAVPRADIESELNSPESMYQRLRLVMDAWCTLWFWPVRVGTTQPPSLDEWIATLEDILGVEPKAAKVSVHGRKTTSGQDALGLFGQDSGWAELAETDQGERVIHSMKPMLTVATTHPWLGVVRKIAEREGFFHWELDFAPIFARGGFDLQVGNPPWVRPRWEDNLMLAESEPFFKLTDNIPDQVLRNRRDSVLRDGKSLSAYLSDLASWVGLNEHTGSEVEHPLLSGVQNNLYLNFMERTWMSPSTSGAVGLLHPEGHFSDAQGGAFREACYIRLRRHWQFRNQLKLFDEIDNGIEFSINVYGHPRVARFLNACYLLHPETIDLSMDHDGTGEEPGVRYPRGDWDFRPHRSRIVVIDEQVLAIGVRLFDPDGESPLKSRMIRPLTVEHMEVLRAFAEQGRRIGDINYHWTRGWDEKGAKETGFIAWDTGDQAAWDDVILQGPLFSIATPFAKKPNIPCKSNKDYTEWELESLPGVVVPRTNYRRACGIGDYRSNISIWTGEPYVNWWRLCWRRMSDPGAERSLISALMPPGPTHVHTVHSLALIDNAQTAVISGLWASLPMDYLVKVGGKADIQDELIQRFPAPLEHLAVPYLLLRTLRLNCLTRDYSPLWEELFEDGFAADSWTPPFQWRTHLGDVTREWSMATPLRTEYDRRAALVETDALAAIMLGITAEQLCAIYRAQFGVLRKYEYTMFFDAQGRKIAKETHARGWKQEKGDYELAEQWWREYGDSGEVRDLPEQLRDRYRAPLVKPDREAEMTAAYNDFTNRLALRNAGSPNSKG